MVNQSLLLFQDPGDNFTIHESHYGGYVIIPIFSVKAHNNPSFQVSQFF